MKKEMRRFLLGTATMGLFTAIPALSSAAPVVWMDSFVQNQAPTIEQCQAWHGFLEQLEPDMEFTSVTMSGTFAPEGISITDPAAIQELAHLLYSRTPGSVSSDGHTWTVGIGCNLSSCVPAGQGVELTVDQLGGCGCVASGYTVRPDIGLSHWGGINTKACLPPNQTMMVAFQTPPDMSPTIMIGECDSGVDNFIIPEGNNVNDEILECEAIAKNHGLFVKCVSQLLNYLKKEGLISGKDKGAIQACAATNNI